MEQNKVSYVVKVRGTLTAMPSLVALEFNCVFCIGSKMFSNFTRSSCYTAHSVLQGLPSLQPVSGENFLHKLIFIFHNFQNLNSAMKNLFTSSLNHGIWHCYTGLFVAFGMDFLSSSTGI
jgi:hypothetical protein